MIAGNRVQSPGSFQLCNTSSHRCFIFTHSDFISYTLIITSINLSSFNFSLVSLPFMLRDTLISIQSKDLASISFPPMLCLHCYKIKIYPICFSPYKPSMTLHHLQNRVFKLFSKTQETLHNLLQNYLLTSASAITFIYIL